MGLPLLWGLAAAFGLAAFADWQDGAEPKGPPWETEDDLKEGNTETLRLTRATQPWKRLPYRIGSLSPLSRGLMRNVVVFEDVAVYFSREEWEELTEEQRELYRAVMMENYEAVRSLGRLSIKPEIISKIEEKEQVFTEDFWKPKWRSPQGQWLGQRVFYYYLTWKKKKEDFTFT